MRRATLSFCLRNTFADIAEAAGWGRGSVKMDISGHDEVFLHSHLDAIERHVARARALLPPRESAAAPQSLTPSLPSAPFTP